MKKNDIKLSSAVQKTINELFKELDKKNVKYVVLRNYEQLPEYLDSKDIDLLVEDNDLELAHNILKEVFKRNNAKSYLKKVSKLLYSTVFYWYDNGNIDNIKIDLFINLEYKGRVFLTSSEILLNRKPYKNFYIPSVEDELIISIFKTYIIGGVIKEKYLIKFSDILRDNKELQLILTDKLSKFLLKKEAKLFIKYIVDNNKKQILQNKVKFDIESNFILLYKNPFIYMEHLISQYYIELIKIINPKYQFDIYIFTVNSEKIIKEVVAQTLDIDIEIIYLSSKIDLIRQIFSLKKIINRRNYCFTVIIVDMKLNMDNIFFRKFMLYKVNKLSLATLNNIFIGKVFKSL